MIGKRIVAILTSEVRPATLHLDGDDIERRVVVSTAGLRINADPTHMLHDLSTPLSGYRFRRIALA
ncbi:MAG: hypothetical protein WBP75_02300 [Candidatus Cybelea sp.]